MALLCMGASTLMSDSSLLINLCFQIRSNSNLPLAHTLYKMRKYIKIWEDR